MSSSHTLSLLTRRGYHIIDRSDELEYLAGHCTEKEDAAEKVERQLRKSSAALLLESRIGQRFEAIVTGASDKGTWVRLLDPPVEGKLAGITRGLDVGTW